MKKHALMLLAVLLLMGNIYAQIPQGFNYQAVLRDSSGEIIKNQEKTITVNIIQKSLDSSAIYTEAHVLTTNDFGLVNMIIGEGTTTDDFSAINWAEGPYFIEISVEGIKMGAQQLMSVPYAMYAGNMQDMEKVLSKLKYLEEINHINYVYDIDSNKYKTIKIGEQVWMAENLKTTHYNDGTPINKVLDDTEWINASDGAYCYYDNDTSNIETYGLLYNYYAVVDPKGLCPEGFHVPDSAEFMTLINYLGGDTVAVTKLKDKCDKYWTGNNEGTTNESGFSAMPAGERWGYNASYNYLFGNATIWSKTEKDIDNAYFLYIGGNHEKSRLYGYEKEDGGSVRCVKDLE